MPEPTVGSVMPGAARQDLPDNCNGDFSVPFETLFNLFEFILPFNRVIKK